MKIPKTDTVLPVDRYVLQDWIKGFIGMVVTMGRIRWYDPIAITILVSSDSMRRNIFTFDVNADTD